MEVSYTIPSHSLTPVWVIATPFTKPLNLIVAPLRALSSVTTVLPPSTLRLSSLVLSSADINPFVSVVATGIDSFTSCKGNSTRQTSLLFVLA